MSTLLWAFAYGAMVACAFVFGASAVAWIWLWWLSY